MFTLHNGDCRPYMKAMPDKSVDVIVTDPPYGMNYLSNHYKGENPFQAIAGDDRYPAELIPEFQRIARKAVFAFCRWDNLSEVPPPHIVYCVGKKQLDCWRFETCLWSYVGRRVVLSA